MENETPTNELPRMSFRPGLDSLAQQAKAWRISRGWRQVDMALELGISVGTVGKIERGYKPGRHSFSAYLRVTGINLWPASPSQGDTS